MKTIKSILHIAIFTSLLVISSCSKNGSSVDDAFGQRNSPILLTITSPHVSDVFDQTQSAALSVVGTCTGDATTVKVTEVISGVTATSTCSSGAWSSLLNLSLSVDGSLNLKAELIVDGVSSAEVSRVVFKDSLSPNAPVFSVPASATTVYATDYTFTWSATDRGMAGLRPLNTYKVETFSVAACAGAADLTLNQASSSYTRSGLNPGSTYSVKVSAYDSLNQLSATTCSANVLADVPAVLTISAPVASALQGSAGITTVAVAGTCSGVGRSVTITAPGGATATTACSSNAWSTTINLTSAAEGNLTLTASLIQSAVSIKTETVAIVKDTSSPNAPTFSAPTTATSIVGASYTFAWSTADVGLAGLRTANTYQVETFQNGVCSGAAVATTTQATASFSYGSLVNGSTYSIRIRAYDNASNVSTATCSSAITVNTAAPVLALTDGTTSSAVYIRQVATAVSISSDSLATKWCLSQTQTTAPANGAATCTGGSGSSDGWHTTKPTSFTMTTGDALKTLYLWIADASGNVIATSSTDTITLDTTAPATPAVAVVSNTTSSATNTNQSLLDLAITSDTDAAKWCVMETLDSAAAPTAPLYNNVCFVASRPTAATLTGRGLRRISVFTLDAAGNVSAAAGTDTLDYPLPTVLEMAGPSSIPQSGCSELLRVTQKDAYGLLSLAPTATVVTFSGAGAGTYYSDAGCTTSATTVSIAIGQSSAKYYYKSATLGAVTLGVSGLSTTATLASSVDTVYQMSASLNGTICAIVAGSAQCWGRNFGDNDSLMGNGLSPDQPAPTQATGLSTMVTSLSVWDNNVCAVQNGVVKCWGQNYGGQLGTGDYTSSPTPITVSGSGSTGAREVSVGSSHGCAVVGEAAYCWGSNNDGQVGDNSQTQRLAPVAVTGLATGVTAISAGSYYSCAIVNGGMKCWGAGWSGQLGNGASSFSTTPVDVTGLTSGVTDISTGQDTTCAIKSGDAYCWGANYASQLGDGTETSSNVPVLVATLPAGMTKIAAGTNHTCATNGTTTYCWGKNISGQVGSGTITAYPYVATPAVAAQAGLKNITVGNESSCGVTTGNVLKCWGGNQKNQLGNGSNAPINVPTPTLSLGASATSISAGGKSMCAIAGGAAKCWGSNDNKQLGVAVGIDFSTPQSTATFGSSVTKISSGEKTSCGIQSGTAYCWGDNTNKQMGSNGGTSDSPIAVQSMPAGTKSDISTSLKGTHSCAVVANGVVCWGLGSNGRLGNGGTTLSASPVTATGLAPSGGVIVTQVSAGTEHTCALGGSKVYCWGKNNNNQLGNGNTTDLLVPTEVVSSGATYVSAGHAHTCAVISGGVSCWGSTPNTGAAGYNGTHSTPFSIIAASSGVTKVVAGYENSCALYSSGTVKCWGRGIYGRLGNNDPANAGTYLPTTVAGITSGATDIAVGDYHACAIVSGIVKCWGENYAGVLGDGAVQGQNASVSPTLVGAPAKIALSGATTSTAASCSSAITITLQTSAGVGVNAPADKTINLTNGGSGTFYDTAGCSGGGVTSVVVTTGTSTKSFYYLAPTATEVGITASGTNLIRAALKHNAN